MSTETPQMHMLMLQMREDGTRSSVMEYTNQNLEPPSHAQSMSPCRQKCGAAVTMLKVRVLEYTDQTLETKSHAQSMPPCRSQCRVSVTMSNAFSFTINRCIMKLLMLLLALSRNCEAKTIQSKQIDLPAKEFARIWKQKTIVESANRLFGSVEIAKQEVAKMPIWQWYIAGTTWKTLLPPFDPAPLRTIRKESRIVYADAQRKNVTSNDVFVEVGSNCGQWPVFWLKAMKVKHVFAVEPNRLAAFFFKWNVIMNRLDKQVTFHEAACVPDSSAEPSVVLSQANGIYNSSVVPSESADLQNWMTGAELDDETIRRNRVNETYRDRAIYDVPTISLADLSAMVRKRFGHDTKYLKMNCEGCEVRALGLTDRSVLETFENLFRPGLNVRRTLDTGNDWNLLTLENFHKRLCTQDVWLEDHFIYIKGGSSRHKKSCRKLKNKIVALQKKSKVATV